MSKTRFVMLVGIAGSGKSTISKGIIHGESNIIYLSSDLLRLELFGSEDIQDNNAIVFEEMLKRTKQALLEGKDVIYDATNLSRKKRRGLLQQLPKDVDKIALYLNVPIEKIKHQNECRERVVPEDVIDRMYKNCQIPVYSEGWDRITYLYDDETEETELPKQYTDAVRAGVLFGREGYELMRFLATFFNPFLKIYDMPQDSKHHSLSVSRHTYYVYKYALDNYQCDLDYVSKEKEIMLWVALLHDLGKDFCKSFVNRKGEETRYANFIGHENVSAQLAAHILRILNFDDDMIYEVCTLIQFHMYLLDDKANKDKLRQYVGDKRFKMLDFLREADTKAH